MFLPTTKKELSELGWKKLDIILISGDTYIDSSFSGIALIGKVLLRAGYKVGIIAQPDIRSDKDIKRLGEAELFWGISSGCVDSMVANFTAIKKRRYQDDLTPGGRNIKRPDRAIIVYTNLIRRHFKNTKPIILGGIEASLRRIAHYDYWSDKIRRSILFDSKADYLVYGMGEKAIIEIAQKLSQKLSIEDTRGICYISKNKKYGYIELPSFEEVAADKNKFIKMFHLFYQHNEPVLAKGLYQQHGNRYLIQNPPAHLPTKDELDSFYDLDFERDVHPFCKKEGDVRALETIKFSITTHRGCYGKCSFCAISVHQGTTIVSRTEQSILNEANTITKLPDFKGYITDVGGPTANMYAIECDKKIKDGICIKKYCTFPKTCKKLQINHKPQIELHRKIRKIDKVKKVFVASGLRYDMIIDDEKYGEEYLNEIIKHHICGQLKVAPEHIEDRILKLMRKSDKSYLIKFKKQFDKLNRRSGKQQFLTYYFIAAHPGASLKDEQHLKSFISKELNINPQQVQIFTPVPSTYSTLMYYTEMNPWTYEKLSVTKNIELKIQHKKILIKKLNKSR